MTEHTVGMLRTPVFVYGTLKRGFSNHGLLSEARFLGEGLTIPKFAMYKVGFPVLMESNGSVGRITGELYEVSARTLERLDMLEGVGRMYTREKVRVMTTDGVTEAMIYIGHPGMWMHRLQTMRVQLPDANGHITYAR